jgi:ATP-dependent exoDNAse (exonuclease V) alpha subunit
LAAVLQKYEQMNFAGKPLCIDEKDAPVLIDPIWDIQIIVAVNNTSELARKTLNLKLQDLLNPDARRVANNPFRVGDKAINTKNSEYKAVGKIESWLEIDNLPSEPTRHYVANGEQAEVLDVDAAKIVSRLSQPDRTIMIPRSAKSVDDEHPGKDSESEEATGSGCAWELGYAISGHKSQGSEWPIVIVMVDDYNGAKMVQSKQWIYTAVSRAKRLCIMIGQQKTINACCQRDALFQRKTFLKERILELRSRLVITKEIWDLLLEGVC